MRLLFDGVEVGRAEATKSGSSPRVNVDISFTVPEAEPGPHDLTAVGADFTADCRTGNGERFEVEGSAEVRGAQVERARGNDDGQRGIGGLGFGGSLPRTGATIGVLLLIAAVLLAGGRYLLGWSRRYRGSSA